jgi:lysophospholipid acyltransferase (LPLAT)-like uncharacterized protein
VRPFKRVLGNEAVRRFLCRLGAQYIRLAHATGTWTTVRDHIPRRFWDEGKPFILCFWHGRLLMMPYCWDRGATIHMLISQHRDGQIIANTVSHFGIETVAGSSTRGGAAAMRAMLKVLKGGDYVGITPDGPRGPRMRASDGVIGVARLAGVPIIPAAYGVNKRSVLSSWDRFIVAWPFARGVVVWGEPIEVPRDADEGTSEAARLRVEDTLNAVTREADDLCGVIPIEPAPATGEAAT